MKPNSYSIDAGQDARVRLPDQISRQADRYRAHAAFREKLLSYCATVSKPPPGQWPMAKLFDQFTRYLTCYVLIHNYYAWRNAGGPPPTLSLLQPAVEASPRQTAGFIASLKAGRLVTVESAPGDRRSKLLRPAPEMIREIGRSVQAFVVAGEALDGEAIIGPRLAEDPDALGDLLYRSAADVLARGTLIHPFPRVLFFARRDCGYLLFCVVMRAHYAVSLGTGDSVPLLSYRALADRLQVSPAHIGNLLGEAERNGWFTVGARGRLVEIDPDLVAEFEVWAACQMAHFATLSRETAAFLGSGESGASLMTGPAS